MGCTLAGRRVVAMKSTVCDILQATGQLSRDAPTSARLASVALTTLFLGSVLDCSQTISLVYNDTLKVSGTPLGRAACGGIWSMACHSA
jgi:hypothetical protein